MCTKFLGCERELFVVRLFYFILRIYSNLNGVIPHQQLILRFIAPIIGSS